MPWRSNQPALHELFPKLVDQDNNRQFIIVLRSAILLNASCACALCSCSSSCFRVVKTKKSCPWSYAKATTPWSRRTICSRSGQKVRKPCVYVCKVAKSELCVGFRTANSRTRKKDHFSLRHTRKSRDSACASVIQSVTASVLTFTARETHRQAQNSILPRFM
jgi:hypothetical protein